MLSHRGRQRRIGLLLGSTTAALTLLRAGVAVAKSDPARDLAQRIEELHLHAGTLRASFKQTFVHRASGKKTVKTGRMAAAYGGKLSFRYDSPKGDRVACNGEIVKLYEKADKRVFMMRLTRARHAMAMAFLLDELRLSRAFHLRLLDPKRKKVKRGSVLEAVPKKPNPMVSRLLFYVNPSTAQVMRVMVIDAQGNTNRFDFKKRRYGEKIPAKEFRFKPPKGTKVIVP